MRPAFACLILLILATISTGFGQEPTQEKPKENPPPAADAAKPPATDEAKAADAAKPATESAKPASADRKNPVTPTPENLAAAKKMYGYDCAMCHGTSGDGKGDMVESMKLSMKDWRDVAALTGISDAAMFEIIMKGKGKMTGEGDRLPANQVWGMVNYVRSLAKKGGGAAAPAEAAPKQ
jgi:mono/diheme cytochrome c family protein